MNFAGNGFAVITNRPGFRSEEAGPFVLHNAFKCSVAAAVAAANQPRERKNAHGGKSKRSGFGNRSIAGKSARQLSKINYFGRAS